MKRFLIVCLLLAFAPFAQFAYADNGEDYIDGASYDEYDILDWRGMPAPSVSPAGHGRTYFDSTSNTLKLSQNAGAYSDIITETLGDGLYHRLDGSTTGLLDATEVYNSAGDLKIMPDIQGDVVLFGDTDGVVDANGKSLYIYRKAAEEDKYIRLYISGPDVATVAYLTSDAPLGLTSSSAMTISSGLLSSLTLTGYNNVDIGASRGRIRAMSSSIVPYGSDFLYLGDGINKWGYGYVDRMESVHTNYATGGLGKVGPNLVINGTFAADSDWDLGTGWGIFFGSAHWYGTTAGYLDQDFGSESGVTYRVEFDLSVEGYGRVTPTIGAESTIGSQPTSFNQSGGYVVEITCTGNNDKLRFYADLTAGDDPDVYIDNVAVYKVEEASVTDFSGEKWNLGSSDLETTGVITGGDLKLLADTTAELSIRRTTKDLDNTNVTGSGLVKVAGDFSNATDLDYKVEITTGGDLGTAIFRWSDDGGGTWDKEDVNTPANKVPYNLNNDIRIWFVEGAGTDFNANDYTTFTAIGTNNQKDTFLADATNNDITLADTFLFANSTITDSSGAISFDDENLTTTGTISDGVLTVSDGNITDMGNITGTDVDISAGTGTYSSSGPLGAGAITSTTSVESPVYYFDNALNNLFDDASNNLIVNSPAEIQLVPGMGAWTLTLDDVSGVLKSDAGEFNFDDDNLVTTGQLGVGGSPTANYRTHIIGAAGDTNILYIDGDTNPYTTSDTVGYGLQVLRTIDLPNGSIYDNFNAVSGILNIAAGNSDIDGTTTLRGLQFKVNPVGPTAIFDFPEATNKSLYMYASDIVIDDDATYDTESTGAALVTLVGAKAKVDADNHFTDTGGNTPATTLMTYGSQIDVNNLPTLTSGALTVNNYGQHISVIGSAVGTSANYGVYLYKVRNADTNWGIYDAEELDHLFQGKVCFDPAKSEYVWRSAAGWLNLVAATGVEINAPVWNMGDMYVAGDSDIGAASTNTFAMTGRLIVRTVGADPTTNNTAGSLGEIVFFNDKWYGKTVADGTDQNWVNMAGAL